MHAVVLVTTGDAVAAATVTVAGVTEVTYVIVTGLFVASLAADTAAPEVAQIEDACPAEIAETLILSTRLPKR